MFSIGDRVVYPMHGAGIIEAIEEKEILGELNKYYILSIPYEKMQILVPVKQANNLQIRHVVDNETIEKVFDQFTDELEASKLPWKQRSQKHQEYLKSGDIFNVAKVLCELVARRQLKPLNTSEKNIMEKAKRIFLSELLLVKDITKEEAVELLQEQFKVSLEV